MAKRLTWSDRIARAREVGKFSTRDITAASNWTTCAVGEATGYSRNGDYPLNVAHAYDEAHPEEYRTYSLGIDFVSAVEIGQFDRAEEILGRIKGRLEGLIL